MTSIYADTFYAVFFRLQRCWGVCARDFTPLTVSTRVIVSSPRAIGWRPSPGPSLHLVITSLADKGAYKKILELTGCWTFSHMMVLKLRLISNKNETFGKFPLILIKYYQCLLDRSILFLKSLQTWTIWKRDTFFFRNYSVYDHFISENSQYTEGKKS